MKQLAIKHTVFPACWASAPTDEQINNWFRYIHGKPQKNVAKRGGVQYQKGQESALFQAKQIINKVKL